MPNLFDLGSTEVEQFNDLSLKLMQASIELCRMDEVDDKTLANARQVRSTCQVLLAALGQVASIHTGGFLPPPAM